MRLGQLLASSGFWAQACVAALHLRIRFSLQPNQDAACEENRRQGGGNNTSCVVVNKPLVHGATHRTNIVPSVVRLADMRNDHPQVKKRINSLDDDISCYYLLQVFPPHRILTAGKRSVQVQDEQRS